MKLKCAKCATEDGSLDESGLGFDDPEGPYYCVKCETGVETEES